MPDRIKGIVKWFKDRAEFKYGFITSESHEGDIFAHKNDIITNGFKTLLPGEPVEFELEVTERGAKAKKIIRIKSKLSNL